MYSDLSNILHQRIIVSCGKLFVDGHFPQAALEAMKEVEQALRQLSLVPRHVFGQRLVKRVFQKGRGIQLVVPLGPEYQRHAQDLFEGAFGYYRNYAAHHSEKIDQKICSRVLVIASELLDLLAASERRIEAEGGVKGLVEAGLFQSTDEFYRCLRFYEEGHFCPDEVFDGYWESLAEAGISEDQEKLFWDLNLIQCRPDLPDEDSIMIDVIELSELGRSLLKEAPV